MADEGRINSTVAVELFFKRKNHQSFRDVFTQQADASLPPCPELGAYVVDDRNSAFAHLTSYAPVEGGRVDDDGEIGMAFVSFRDHTAEASVDIWQVADDFGDSDHCQISCVYDGIAACSAHAVPASAEKVEFLARRRESCREAVRTHGFDELSTIHFSRCFAG